MRPSTVDHGLPECPITLQPILDPVKSSAHGHSGLVYEREAILDYGTLSPQTQEPSHR